MDQRPPIYVSTGQTPCMSHSGSHLKPSPHWQRQSPTSRQQNGRSHSRSPNERMNERQINYRTAHYRVRKKHEPNQRAGYSRKLQSAQPTSSVDEDDKAFKAFKTCLNAKRPSRYARTLEKLLNRTLDPESNSISFLLKDILTLTDKVFFNRKLRTNIEWRWSRPNEEGYATDFLGTTTPIYLNDMQNPGHERTQAEIVLSSPFLRSKEYKSTLLISTFIHELVHCYLFVTCGRKAEKNDGHTEAFEKIVHEIEKWLQNDDLRLCNMKADLDFFKAEQDHVVDERDDEADGFVVVPSASPQRQIVCTEEEDCVLVRLDRKGLAISDTSALSSPLEPFLHDSRSQSVSSSWVGSPFVDSGYNSPCWPQYGTPFQVYGGWPVRHSAHC